VSAFAGGHRCAFSPPAVTHERTFSDAKSSLISFTEMATGDASQLPAGTLVISQKDIIYDMMFPYMAMLSEDEDLWRTEARRVLKSRLARHGFSYKDLVSRLNATGASESYAGIANKISRGSFSFAFYLRCIHVLEHTLQDSEAARLLAGKGLSDES
jgi:hypothetical protein